MQVERVAEPGAEWDAFAEGTPGATLAHAAAWLRVVRDAYGLASLGLAARAGGELRGILPLVRHRGLGGDVVWTSMPFLDSGGILARDPAAEEVLLEAALGLVRETGAVALDLRPMQALAPAAGAASPVGRVDLVLPLEADEEAQWKALPGSVRNQTRKAERSGLVLAEGLDGFYGPFAENMRDLGSPVHGVGFFAAAARAFGPRLRFVVTRDERRCVGGLVAIRFADGVTVPWASTLRAERRRCPNNQIYWEAIRWAVAEGAREFDFGRSPVDSGTHRFKKGWGAEERALAWVRLAPDGARLPPSAPGDSALLQQLSALWTRLPVPLTRWLGPPIRKRISS
jgi:serine/alanine adding enzyme